MRIAVIAPPWLPVPPVGYGGTELVLDTLCRGLVGAGHDVLLHTTGDSTCPVERTWTFEEHLGIAQVSPADELRHVLDGYETAARWGAEVVHDHTITGPVWAQVDATVPVVTTNHGPFAEPLRSIYRRLSPAVPLVAISHHQASTAGDIPVRAVIHHGLDVDAVQPGAGTGGYALFLGRMHPTKGVHHAIDVARAAGVPLKIAAKLREPVEHEYFADCVEPRLGGGVEYVGEVGGTAKARLLADATCLLNPIAWAEPFGMVMIEALAAGTPVVGTPCGAAPEIVDDGVTGYLRTGLQGLADAVAAVGEIDRRACRAAVADRFSMQRMAADHLDLFQALAGADRPTVADLVHLVDHRRTAPDVDGRARSRQQHPGRRRRTGTEDGGGAAADRRPRRDGTSRHRPAGRVPN